MIELVFAAAPMVLGYGAAALYPMTRRAGTSVAFRPPAWVFGVAWPILYVLLGAAWVVASRATDNYPLCVATFAALSVTLASWIVVYDRSTRGASWVIVAALSLAVAGKGMASSTTLSALMAPLVGWLVFALVMNTTEVQSYHA